MHAQIQQIRRLPIGAEILPGSGAHFRIHAPKCRAITLVLESPPRHITMTPEGNGYFFTLVPDLPPGTLYRYLLDDDPTPYPDPTSRSQPQGPHGPSQLINPTTFPWTDSAWKGIPSHGQVLYELHIGTFTKEGTFSSAIPHLARLKDLGVTCIEVMPVAEFAGRRGWGYDGVSLFSPFHHYGSPDDFRSFINHAHSLGLAVILDLVYNHFGPDGNYICQYSDHCFSPSYKTDWGSAINFDGEDSAPIREFFISNAIHWIREYHLDGFRFDATQAILDNSPEHILAAITRESRRAAAPRSLYIINENEPQHTCLVRHPNQGGYGMDALWNDDFHHSATVAVTGRNEAHYTDYLGTPQELLSAAKYGYLFQGQRYAWQKKRRGSPALDLPPTSFVHFLQNHDQIANSGTSRRLHHLTSPAELRAITTFFLLMPQTPLLFQGQEFAATSPFYYFADHNPDLAKSICAGRAMDLAQFPSAATEEIQSILLNPCADAAFLRSKLNHEELNNPPQQQIFNLHKDLLRLRREDPAFTRIPTRGDLDGAVLGPQSLCLRFFCNQDRLLLLNLGRDLPLDPAPEPLLAPPSGHRWATLFSSENPRYGGAGTPPPDTESEGWRLPARSAILLHPAPADRASIPTRHRVQASSQDAKRVD